MRAPRAIVTLFLVAPLSLAAQGTAAPASPAAAVAPRAFQPNDWHRVKTAAHGELGR